MRSPHHKLRVIDDVQAEDDCPYAGVHQSQCPALWEKNGYEAE